MSVAQDLPSFGQHLTHVPFNDIWDWLLSIRDPKEIWAAHASFLISEYVFYILAFLTLIHACIVGGRWKYFWFGSLVHGLVAEALCFAIPDIDNYWHAQSSVMLLGRRLPLHVTLLYPVFMYTSAYVVSHMRLPSKVQPLAAGLAEVLMDLPYDLVAIKFLHWTWHDTDPNILDRHHWIPWTSFYYHLAFGASFNFFLRFWRARLTGVANDNTGSSSFIREVLAALLAGVCGMPGGVIMFFLFYHPLHDILGVSAPICFVIFAATCLLLVWGADRVPPTSARREKDDKTHWSSFLVIVCLLTHFGFFVGLAALGVPQEEVSIGLHQTTGPCDHYSDVTTVLGMTLKKQTYLCLKNFDEKYFDFHCLKKLPPDGASWYTICGTPFENKPEYLAQLGAICIAALIIYYNLLFKSSPTILIKNMEQHKSNKSKNLSYSKKFKKN